MAVPNEPAGPDESTAPSPGTYFSRVEALQLRVNEAARALHERGIRPTVARIRAALGGGSPNDLAPALKHWRESVLPEMPAGSGVTGDRSSQVAIPPMIADLAHELWQRATAAAAVELKGGPTARQVIARTEEAQALRNQLSSLRNQLERDALAYGELRAQSARHEAIAKDALSRVRDADARERGLLRNLGEANQRLAELEATVEQLRSREPRAPASRPSRVARKRARAPVKRPTRQLLRRPPQAAKSKRSRASPKPRPRHSSGSRRKARRR